MRRSCQSPSYAVCGSPTCISCRHQRTWVARWPEPTCTSCAGGQREPGARQVDSSPGRAGHPSAGVVPRHVPVRMRRRRHRGGERLPVGEPVAAARPADPRRRGLEDCFFNSVVLSATGRPRRTVELNMAPTLAQLEAIIDTRRGGGTAGAAHAHPAGRASSRCAPCSSVSWPHWPTTVPPISAGPTPRWSHSPTPTDAASVSSPPPARATIDSTSRQVERTFNAMVATMDPTPVPLFARVEDHRRAGISPGHEPASTPSLESRLVGFADALVGANIAQDDKHLHLGGRGLDRPRHLGPPRRP